MDVTLASVVLLVTVAFVFLLVWVIVILPQNRARKNQEQVVADLNIGEQIVTVGGVIGKLTYLDREKDLAKIEVAPGVEIRIIPAAISHPLDYMDRVRRLERESNKPASKKTDKAQQPSKK